MEHEIFGFVGVGRMGTPMSTRLLNAGHRLCVFDTDEKAVAALEKAGAQRAGSAAEVANNAQTVFLSLPNPEIVHNVALGRGGVIEGTRVKHVADFSTIGPRTAGIVARALAERKITYVDAPVSGGVKGAREGAITAVTMETRKPPRGLAGAPYIEQHRIDLDAIAAETLIFEGPATEAVRAFPANVNVVAALSLAGIGPERTRIKLYAVPGQARNQHRITIEGEFGTLRIEVENVPSENPRTGRLSYLSAIAMLREMGSAVQIGN